MKEIRIRIQCARDKDHAKILRFSSHLGREYAEAIGEICCGTSKYYIYPPQERSPIGRCGMCHSALSYTIEEIGLSESIFTFGDYWLRPCVAEDLQLAFEWTVRDAAHKGKIDPKFWIEQGPMGQTYLLHDPAGPVFFFKGILRGRTLEVYVQFPPAPDTVTNPKLRTQYDHRARLALALIQGTKWLEERMAGVIDRMSFESLSPDLIAFAKHRLGFEEQDGKLQKVLTGAQKATV